MRRRRRRLFSPGNELEFKDETIKVLPFEHSFFMVRKVGYFGKQVRNSWKVLKCGAGEGWRRVKYEVLHKFEGKRNIVYTVKRRKVNWIGHILRWNCLLKYVIEGKIKGEMEVTRRRGRRRRKLLDDLKDRRGYSHLKEEALDRTTWRNRFRGGFGPSSDRILNK